MIQSDFYTDSCSRQTISPYLMFEGVIPPFNEAQKLEALTRGIDNMNVNIYSFTGDSVNDGRFVLLNDFWKVYEFDPLTLETKRSVTAEVPHKKGSKDQFAFLNMLSSAHPLPESGTKSQLTFLSSVSLIPWIKSTISLIRIISLDKREVVCSWEVDKVPYMHSFSATHNYAILFASPFYVNTLKMVKSAEPFLSLDWNQREATQVYVIHLKTGELTVLETDNMFTMHHVNAYELDDKNIIVDVSSYPNPDFVSNLQMDILLDPQKRNNFDAHARLVRYVIDMSTSVITREPLYISERAPFSINIDMPVINEEYRYTEYCYAYGVVLKYTNTSLGSIAIAKKNMCGNASQDAFWAMEGHYPVEPWFVPLPGHGPEDAGYIMVPVIDGTREKSYLAIIDARNMTLVNKADLPTIVPYNLHGRFFEDIV